MEKIHKKEMVTMKKLDDQVRLSFNRQHATVVASRDIRAASGAVAEWSESFDLSFRNFAGSVKSFSRSFSGDDNFSFIGESSKVASDFILDVGLRRVGVGSDFIKFQNGGGY